MNKEVYSPKVLLIPDFGKSYNAYRTILVYAGYADFKKSTRIWAMLGEFAESVDKLT